jgi:hypothetical protein
VAGPFVIGGRVRLTEKAKEMRIKLKGGAETGILVGLKPPLGLVVRPEGYKTKINFHMDFWEPIDGRVL